MKRLLIQDMQVKTFEQKCEEWAQAFKDCKNLEELQRLESTFIQFRNLSVLNGDIVDWSHLKPIMVAYKQQKQILTNL